MRRGTFDEFTAGIPKVNAAKKKMQPNSKMFLCIIVIESW
jgi:hypothetical protein